MRCNRAFQHYTISGMRFHRLSRLFLENIRKCAKGHFCKRRRVKARGNRRALERGRGIRCKKYKSRAKPLDFARGICYDGKAAYCGFQAAASAAHPAIASLRKRQAEICLQLLKRAVSSTRFSTATSSMSKSSRPMKTKRSSSRSSQSATRTARRSALRMLRAQALRARF